MKPQAIRPATFPWFDYTRYTFSLGLQVQGRVWLSGHSASEYDSGEGHIVVRGDMEQQARTAYDKVGVLLETAGRSVGDVQRIVEYVTEDGIGDYAAASGVREEVFGSHTPSVCTVVVKRLLRSKALLEIEVTADESESLAGDVVYLPSLTAEAGSLVQQTESVFKQASAQLADLGLDSSHITKTVDYTTPATLKEYKQTAAVRREFLGPVYPASAGILLGMLRTPANLTSVDVIASRTKPEAVNPGWSRYDKLTYSPAVKAGDCLFMSGQAALDPETEKAMFPGDIAAQAEYTYTNVLEVLKAAGGGPEHLVKTIEYVTPHGLPSYRRVAGIRESLLKEPYPASTGVVCEALLRPEFLFEVDPFALLP